MIQLDLPCFCSHLLFSLSLSLSLPSPPSSLSHVLPHNTDGSHHSAELLVRVVIEPVALRNLEETDGRNGRAARVPCPRDLQQFVSGYVPAVLHAEGLQPREQPLAAHATIAAGVRCGAKHLEETRAEDATWWAGQAKRCEIREQMQGAHEGDEPDTVDVARAEVELAEDGKARCAVYGHAYEPLRVFVV